MNSTTFGIPNTLPPLNRRDLRGCLFFGGMGLFVLLLGLFPSLRPPPRLALPLALCWLALPAWGLFRYFIRRPRSGWKQTRRAGARDKHAGSALHGHHGRRWRGLLPLGKAPWRFVTSYFWHALAHRGPGRNDRVTDGVVAFLAHRHFVRPDGWRISRSFCRADLGCCSCGRGVPVGQFAVGWDSQLAVGPDRIR